MTWTEQFEELWDIYDEDGIKQNRTMKRGEEVALGDYHLVVHIWVQNTKKEFLIQKRSWKKKYVPGIWEPASGSVIAGESGLEGAKRELEEELGIKAKDLEFLFWQRTKGVHRLVWLLIVEDDNVDLSPNPEEVDDVSWVTYSTIERMVSTEQFFDFGRDYFELLRAQPVAGGDATRWRE